MVWACSHRCRLRLRHTGGEKRSPDSRLGSQEWSSTSAGMNHPHNIQQWKATWLLSAGERQNSLETTPLHFFKRPKYRFSFIAIHPELWQREGGTDWSSLRRFWSGKYWGETWESGWKTSLSRYT